MAIRQVATGAEVPGLGVNTAQAAGLIKHVCRTRHYLGIGVTRFRLVWGGYYCLTTGGETNHGNDQALNASVEIPGAPGTTLRRVQFGGVNAGTIANGAAEYLSDWLYPADFGYSGTFPDGLVWWLKDEREVPTGGSTVKGRAVSSPAITGEGCYYGATTATSQVDTAGALTTTGGWSNLNQRYFPIAIVGETASPQLAVALVGDSIITYSNDGAGDGVNGAGGFAKRALADIGGVKVPWLALSVPGERAQQLAASTKRAQLYKYATHALSNYGTNDIGGARTAAQIRADLRTIWAALKAAGIARVEQVLLLPRAQSSSDSYATEAGQTILAAYQSGGTRDQANANIAADVGSNGLDALLDLNGVAAGTDPTRWKVNGTANYATSDGLHPSPAMHGLMATPTAARMATWTVATDGNAAGTIGTVTAAMPLASATGGAEGVGAIGTAALIAPSGIASGGAAAAGALPVVTIVAATGSANGVGGSAGNAAGALGMVAASAPQATAAGLAMALGPLGIVTIVAPTGAAVGTSGGTVTEPVSLAMARRQCRIDADDASEDDLLRAYIVAARMWVEEQTSHVLLRRQFVDELRGGFAGPVRLYRRPVISIDAIDYDAGDGVEAAYAGWAARLGAHPVTIHPAIGAGWPILRAGGGVRVTYTAGHAEGAAPAPLVQAMLLLVAHWYKSWEAVSVGPNNSAGASELPMGVAALLQSYRSYAV